MAKLEKESADKGKIKELKKSIKEDEEFVKNYQPSKEAKIIINKNENIKYLIFVAIVVIIAGFITPTGFLPFTYFIKIYLGNTMSYINEHLPVVIASSIEIFAFIIITIACIAFIDSKIKLSDAFLLVGLYMMTIMSRRHMYLLFLLCGPILIKMIDDFVKKHSSKTKTDNQVQTFENYCLAFIAIVAVFVGIYQIVQKYDDDYIDETLYPIEASEWLIDYIEENDIETEEFRIYNQYNYGSYLLYKGIPVFIDSRCDLYTPEFNEDVTVFDDYMEVASGLVHYSKLFEQYDINYAIVYQDSMENTYMKEDDNCAELYSDEYFVIYQYLK